MNGKLSTLQRLLILSIQFLYRAYASLLNPLQRIDLLYFLMLRGRRVDSMCVQGRQYYTSDELFELFDR